MEQSPSSRRRTVKRMLFAACVVLGLGLLALAGCRSADKSGTGQTAAVVIRGNTPGQVVAATIAVFESHGFRSARTATGNLVFEKQGSHFSNFAYGNWMGDTDVWERVKVTALLVAEAEVRLSCHAVMVRDRGRATEEEIKPLRRSPYQKLLDEIAARFTTQPAS